MKNSIITIIYQSQLFRSNFSVLKSISEFVFVRRDDDDRGTKATADDEPKRRYLQRREAPSNAVAFQLNKS